MINIRQAANSLLQLIFLLVSFELKVTKCSCHCKISLNSTIFDFITALADSFALTWIWRPKHSNNVSADVWHNGSIQIDPLSFRRSSLRSSWASGNGSDGFSSNCTNVRRVLIIEIRTYDLRYWRRLLVPLYLLILGWYLLRILLEWLKVFLAVEGL